MESNVINARRRVSITTEQENIIYFDFLESRDGRTFQSHYSMVIDQADATQVSTVTVIMAWLDFNDDMMVHPELMISGV